MNGTVVTTRDYHPSYVPMPLDGFILSVVIVVILAIGLALKPQG